MRASCSHHEETTLSARRPLRDVIDVRGLLGEQRGLMEGGPHRDHQLERLGDRGERGRGGPGIEAGRIRRP